MMAIGTERARPGDTGSSPASGAAGSEGAGERSMGAGQATGDCVPEACPEANLLGLPARGCCQQDGTCGASFELMGASLCVPVNLPAPAGGLPSPSALLPTESIVPDPSCPGRSFFGTELPGCCDPTGVCGVSTEPFASGGMPLPGLEIPVTCIAPGEISFPGLPVAAPASAPATVACGTGALEPDAPAGENDTDGAGSSGVIEDDAGTDPDAPDASSEGDTAPEDAGSDGGAVGEQDPALDAGIGDAGSDE